MTYSPPIKERVVQLPSLLLTSEPGSFARRTFQERIPRIVDEIIATNDYPAEIVGALRALREEIVSSVIRPLEEETDDQEFWNEHAREHIGKSWLDVPWYWGEAFFYRRVLQAVRYFQPGMFYRRDPFASQKRGEFAPDRAPHALQTLLEHLPPYDAETFRALVYASLRGNRTDLSYLEILSDARNTFPVEHERANLLVDDIARVWDHLQNTHGGRVDFISDNAGTELVFDLTLADFLLHIGLATQVVFHLKPQPFFVSDAMIQDVLDSLDILRQSASPELHKLAQRLAKALSKGLFVLTDHPFWITGFFFHKMPSHLRMPLAKATLVISKGDANYRRLIGDCHWEPTTPFELAAGYFPTSIVAVRTMKAELIVGLHAGEVERLQAEDPAWMVNGKRGVIQFKGS